MRVATYSRWALIRGWALIKFLDLDESGCLFKVGAYSRLRLGLALFTIFSK